MFRHLFKGHLGHSRLAVPNPNWPIISGGTGSEGRQFGAREGCFGAGQNSAWEGAEPAEASCIASYSWSRQPYMDFPVLLQLYSWEDLRSPMGRVGFTQGKGKQKSNKNDQGLENKLGED